MLPMAVLPVFVSTNCIPLEELPMLVLGKVAEEGVSDVVVVAARPVPVSEDVSVGNVASVEVTVSVLLCAPVAEGENTTLMMHVPPAGTMAGQVLLLCVGNSVTLLETTLLTVSFAPELLVKVKVIALELWPTMVLGKFCEVGVSVAPPPLSGSARYAMAGSWPENPVGVVGSFSAAGELPALM